jgi:hypothetical protein
MAGHYSWSKGGIALITSHVRGNPIVFRNERWEYEDGTPIDKEERPCKRCGQLPTKEGYDACLGHIKGAKHACCGHGVTKPCIKY